MAVRKLAFVVLLMAIFGMIFFQQAMKNCKQLPPLQSQAGKIVVVTGGNSGLGLETSNVLAAAGATVVMGCRSMDRGSVARSGILNVHPQAVVDVIELDLSSFDSVRNFATVVKERYQRVDVLINNAGIMALPTRELTQDGLEAQIGTNHFGHFLLTSLLFPLLSPDARVINHSSEVHRQASNSFPVSNLQSDIEYSPWVAYANSKSANLMFTYELNHRLEAIGNPKKIVSIAVHPGYTNTNLQMGKFPFADQINALFAMNVEDGALAQIYAAAGSDVTKSMNDYFGPRYYFFGAPAVLKTESKTWDRSRQVMLWNESLRVIGADSCFVMGTPR